jgi:hypothetical protein
MAISPLSIIPTVHGDIVVGDSILILNDVSVLDKSEWTEVTRVNFPPKAKDMLKNKEEAIILRLYQSARATSINYFVVLEDIPYTYPIQIIYPHIFEGNSNNQTRVTQFEQFSFTKRDTHKVVTNGLFALINPKP